jgi:hypothetical protein
MKKVVMTAVVACAASIVSAQVYSANIVGYATKTLDSGSFEIVSPQFLQSGGEAITLGTAFSDAADQSVIYMWTGAGYTVYTYYAGYGWYDLSFNPADDIVVAGGDAMWLKGGAAAADVMMMGEVESATDVAVTVTAGFNLIANPYPVALALGSIDNTALTEGDVIYVWGGAGYTVYTYYLGYGWYDLSFNPVDSVTVPVGQGFWLKAAAAGTLTFDKNF